MSAPLVSIVTPSFNQAAFLEETIRSVLAQDYPNLEYVVIDGGSTDGSVDIIRKYADRLAYWVSEPDGGQAEAINKGLARCTGQVFNWLNSDDVLAPGAVQAVARVWQETREPRIVYGLAKYVDQDGHDLGYCPAQCPALTPERVLQVGKYLLIQPAAFVPLAQVRTIGGLNVQLHYALDFDLYTRLHLPLVHVPSVFAFYRLHKDSKTVAGSLRFVDEVASVLQQAASAGRLPSNQARSRAALFSATANLSPDVRRYRKGINSLAVAVRVRPASLPRAAVVLIKALSRLTLGEEAWARARSALIKWRGLWSANPTSGSRGP